MNFCWSGLTRRSSEKALRMKCSVIGTNGMRSTQTVTTRYDLNHLHCKMTGLSFHKMQLEKMQLSKSTSKQDRQDSQFIPDAYRCALKQQKQQIRMTTTLGKVVDTVLTFACETNHSTLPLRVRHFFFAQLNSSKKILANFLRFQKNRPHESGRYHVKTKFCTSPATQFCYKKELYL